VKDNNLKFWNPPPNVLSLIENCYPTQHIHSYYVKTMNVYGLGLFAKKKEKQLNFYNIIEKRKIKIRETLRQ